MVGLGCKFFKNQKGITLIEALVSTVIIGIGFVAIFQMVQYSVRSIDVSGERTKSNLLISMVAEDLISEKNSTSPTSKVSFVDYLVSEEKKGKASWNSATCSTGSSSSKTFTNTLDAKKYKWDNRFSKRRLKCDSNNVGKKELKIFEICKTCKYNNDDILEKIYFGKMKVTIKSSGTDSSGKQRKKTKLLYFQIN